MTREQIYSNLEEKYGDWLGSLKQSGFSAASHYVSNLKAIGEPIEPHTKFTAKWNGLYELLTGKRPTKGIYAIKSVNEFATIYGSAVPFFTAEKNEKEQIRPLYPKCKCFDDLFDFAYQNGNATTLGDGGHTRNGFMKYCQFLCDLESKVDGVPTIVSTDDSMPHQLITYGAPGTGKSKGVNDTASKLPKEDVIRTTFHPDSDYSTFVGAYKPKMDIVPLTRIDGDEIKKVTKGDSSLLTEKRISYEFVPQAFAKAYVQAWKKMAAAKADGQIAPVMLIIEEINRGDCAKIFGDLFQLLDRIEKDDENDPKKKAGFSEYPILADSDLAHYIREELKDVSNEAIFKDYPSVIAEKNLELLLPPNMYIWATMNTSDQSLFPMDSAFKRRWDWKYVPIKNHTEENWKIVIGEKEYSWGSFLEKINKHVLDLTNSEDKQLGYFFVKTPNKTIDANTFVNKVLFFLWNVMWKDCYTECDYLKNGNEYFTFRDFFDDDGNANVENINKVLTGLEIGEWATNQVSSESSPTSTAEAANAPTAVETPAAVVAETPATPQ